MRRLMMLFLLVLAPELALAQQRTYIPPQIGATPGSPGSFTLTGPLLLPDGTAAAPALAFASATNYGLYYAGGALRVSAGGAQRAKFESTNFVLLSDSGYFGLGASEDVHLHRDAANTLALRNGTAAQTFNIYNTYTDASNYERVRLGWVGNTFEIRTTALGTGSARSILINADNTNIQVGNTQPVDDDTRTFGASTFKWATIFASRSIQGSKSKALVEATPTSPVRISVPQTALANYGGGSVGYTVYATDGTDSQSLVGDVRFAMVNKAGTESCTPGEVGTPVLAESAGGSTLTCTWTCATAAADTVDLFANCTSSLVQTTFTVETRGNMQKPNTWTPQ